MQTMRTRKKEGPRTESSKGHWSPDPLFNSPATRYSHYVEVVECLCLFCFLELFILYHHLGSVLKGWLFLPGRFFSDASIWPGRRSSLVCSWATKSRIQGKERGNWKWRLLEQQWWKYMIPSYLPYDWISLAAFHLPGVGGFIATHLRRVSARFKTC